MVICCDLSCWVFVVLVHRLSLLNCWQCAFLEGISTLTLSQHLSCNPIWLYWFHWLLFLLERIGHFCLIWSMNCFFFPTWLEIRFFAWQIPRSCSFFQLKILWSCSFFGFFVWHWNWIIKIKLTFWTWLERRFLTVMALWFALNFLDKVYNTMMLKSLFYSVNLSILIKKDILALFINLNKQFLDPLLFLQFFQSLN